MQAQQCSAARAHQLSSDPSGAAQLQAQAQNNLVHDPHRDRDARARRTVPRAPIATTTIELRACSCAAQRAQLYSADPMELQRSAALQLASSCRRRSEPRRRNTHAYAAARALRRTAPICASAAALR